MDRTIEETDRFLGMHLAGGDGPGRPTDDDRGALDDGVPGGGLDRPDGLGEPHDSDRIGRR